MDRPATATPATAREIILEIVRNMREGLEPHDRLHPHDDDALQRAHRNAVRVARRVPSVRAGVSAAAWEVAWATGHTMPLDRAIVAAKTIAGTRVRA